MKFLSIAYLFSLECFSRLFATFQIGEQDIWNTIITMTISSLSLILPLPTPPLFEDRLFNHPHHTSNIVHCCPLNLTVTLTPITNFDRQLRLIFLAFWHFLTMANYCPYLSIEIQCQKGFYLKPKAAVNNTEISSLICKTILTFNEQNFHYLLVVCSYLEILWRVIFG